MKVVSSKLVPGSGVVAAGGAVAVVVTVAVAVLVCVVLVAVVVVLLTVLAVLALVVLVVEVGASVGSFECLAVGAAEGLAEGLGAGRVLGWQPQPRSPHRPGRNSRWAEASSLSEEREHRKRTAATVTADCYNMNPAQTILRPTAMPGSSTRA